MSICTGFYISNSIRCGLKHVHDKHPGYYQSPEVYQRHGKATRPTLIGYIHTRTQEHNPTGNGRAFEDHGATYLDESYMVP